MIEVEDLDPDKFAVVSLDGDDVDNNWLAGATDAEARSAMLLWFIARFEDPQVEMPWDSETGDYIFINGGPYDAAIELTWRFRDHVHHELIREVVQTLEKDGCSAWAPRSGSEFADDSFDLYVEEQDQPLKQLVERTDETVELLTLKGSSSAIRRAALLAYSAQVSNLEAFLWESAVYWVDKRDDVVRAFIERLPAFQQQEVKLRDLYKEYEQARPRVREQLKRTIWHNWNDVCKIYKHGLGIDLPEIPLLKDAVKKRHDIIHRSGHDYDQTPIDVTANDVRELSEQVLVFCRAVTFALTERFVESETPDF